MRVHDWIHPTFQCSPSSNGGNFKVADALQKTKEKFKQVNVQACKSSTESVVYGI